MTKHQNVALSPGLSVVIPIHRSATLLPQVVARLLPVLRASASNYELILVNDNGCDDTWRVAVDLAAIHPWIRGLCLMRNYGQHNAVLAGIRAARFDVTVTMDDDLQHPPEELPTLLAKLTEELDVVYGTPDQERHGFMRDLASIATKLALQSAIKAETARMVSAFRVFRTRLRDAFTSYDDSFVNIDILLTWGTMRFGAVRVRHDRRVSGESAYTVGKLTRHALNMITGFSVLPLQFASIVGFAFTLFGIGVLAYVLFKYFTVGSSVAGFPFLASIIAIFSGAQLFALGIIGEYLARMHFRLMQRPAYTISGRTDDSS